MISLIRRLLGMDRFEQPIPDTSAEQRDRDDALRSASRATLLARRIRREAHEREYRVRVEVLRR